MELANIPMELKERPQWLLWKYEMREKRRTKIPYSARTGKPARWQDPESWAPFGEAVWMLKDKQFDGIGFVLTSADPWTGVDIDHCLNQETGEIDAEAMEIVRALSTYTEITPSGTGLHLFCRAKLPEGRRRAGRLEMYDSDRFLTMTGELLPGGPVAIQDRQEQMNALHAATFPEAEGRPQLARAGPVTVPADDAAVIEKVIRDSHYLALWRGDYSDYSSQSEADLALAGRIGFFVGWDAATVERLFRQSGLYRQKWESDRSGTTYGHITATKACSGVRQAYQWKSNGAAPPPNGGTSVAFVASVAVARHDPQPPVKLEPEALTGLPGAVVEAISPHTEAHPAAVLASFLVGSGCVLGRHRYVYRDGARHCPNEFVCLVGQSAVGRKGTATRRTDEIFSYTVGSDYTKSLYMRGTEGGGEGEEGPVWDDFILRGLGSGEALVEALAKSEDTGGRHLVFEEEFANPLKVMRRDGSTLSEKLRSAWDGSVLANRTKGKHLIAANAHVCVLGHTTESDLRDQMKAAEVFNGFANRFLWIATRRVQLLPFGGGHVDLSGLVERFREAIDLGRREQEMEFDTEVKEIWDQGGLYRLLTERPDNLFGVVTSRADAHVTRLALLYSILDQAAAIRKSHLLAALAFWDFSERTARWLFGQSLGDEYADTIEEAGRERYPGVLTRTEIRDLFGRHAAPGRIPRALGLLEKQGRMERRDLPTGGRPTEAWMLCDRDQCDKSDESPLQRARRLAT